MVHDGDDYSEHHELYHGTFEDDLPSIMQHGLGGAGGSNFDISARGIVYLSNDPDAAEHWARENQHGRQDETVVLRVDLMQIDETRLRPDGNDHDSLFGGRSFTFRGVIPASALSVY